MSDEVRLPPLPEPASSHVEFSADQMREYARQAVLEERARCAALCDAIYAEEQQEPVCYGFAAECASAIRGQEKGN